MAEVYVAFLAPEVVEGGHAEVHPYGVAFDDGGQQRFAARADERADIHVAFADVSRNRRAYRRIAERQFRLCEVGFAHDYRRHGAFVRGDGVVQVELTGRILLEERTDAVQVAFGLEFEGLVFLQLGTCAIHARLIEFRVYDEEHLVFLDVGTLFEKHLFEVSLHAGAYLDELLGPYPAYIFAVNLHVVRGYGLHYDGRMDLGLGTFTENEIEGYRYYCHYDGSCNGLAFRESESLPFLFCHGWACLLLPVI